ncbi:50S ribosomal protein L9 [Planosporangium mesophilum]|uniref:Large ribosomal subunit protein bL9 n=1 Tax=Planosporangium mesophilum TaxID=689768 RepID=A0A8J3TJ06_9ACTN|nr:50S ribosomal protein L9 [Planosporangium mesophilum]NJC82255.1 50S ribosomal protein L9 [Planosporangium mesophilum]GII22305.1 50S ribosomal protein L9 [Planosporangium mesophilum]
MKIILTQEVNGLGSPGDIVEVKGGYGRNYLLPQGFAIPWSRGAEKQIDVIKRARAAREIRDLDHANEVKASLENLSVKLPVRAGEGGRLYGSVTPAEIAAAVKRAGGPDLDKRRLELSGHIKSTGAHKVQIRLHPEVSAAFTLNVVPEK